jgi:hypothetical protein
MYMLKVEARRPAGELQFQMQPRRDWYKGDVPYAQSYSYKTGIPKSIIMSNMNLCWRGWRASQSSVPGSRRTSIAFATGAPLIFIWKLSWRALEAPNLILTPNNKAQDANACTCNHITWFSNIPRYWVLGNTLPRNCRLSRSNVHTRCSTPLSLDARDWARNVGTQHLESLHIHSPCKHDQSFFNVTHSLIPTPLSFSPEQR